MKSALPLLTILSIIIGCNSSIKNSKIQILPNDHPTYYFELGKNKDCSFRERIAYFNNAYSKALEQNIDSIVNKSLSYKAYLYRRNKQSDSSLKYSRKLLLSAQKTKDSFYVGRAYFKIGENFSDQNINDSAFYYFDKSRNTFVEINDSVQAGKKLDLMARILIDDGNNNLAEKLLVESLELIEPHKDSNTLSSIYQNLSLKYKKQFNYEQAKKYIDSSISYTNSRNKKAILRNTKFNILRDNEGYLAAIKGYQNLLNNSFIINNKKEQVRVMDNLAFTKWLSDSADVEKELKSAFEIRKTIKDNSGLIASYSHLMKFYSPKDKSKAIYYANELYNQTIKQKNIEDRLEALEYLRKLSPEKSLEYSNIKLQLTDSLLKAQKISGNKYSSMLYGFGKIEKRYLKEKGQKELVIQKQKTQNIIYAGIGIFIILSSMYLFFYLKTKHRKEKLQEIYKTETRISKKVHDELANDVYQVMTQLQTRNTDDTVPVLDQLEDIYSRTRDISRENNSIETGILYTEELRSMVSRYGSDQTNIIINGLTTTHWTNISAIKKIAVYRALQELMTNMKKHSKATLVAISFKKEGNQMIINYTDNGIGFSKIKENITNGIQNVENRMNAIDGSATFDTNTEKGLKANISFPA